MTKVLSLLLIAFLVISCTSQSTSNTPPKAQEVAQAATPKPATATSAPSPTNSPTPTDTPLPPTATPTSTHTPLPPTSTATSTSTSTPTATPTSTATPTDTPVPPTATPTPTDTPVPPKPTPSAADHLGQAQAFFKTGDGASAITELQTALQQQPDLAEAYKLLGLIYNQQGNLEGGIKALEQYVQLATEANDKAEIQAQIQGMRDKLASKQFGEIPPGKALFVFINYSGDQWNVDVGPYFLEVPPKPVDKDIFFLTQAIEPGSYTWMASSPGGGSRAEDASGHGAFDFTVAAGEIKIACVGGGSTHIGSTDVTYPGGFARTAQDTSYTAVQLCGN